jgi:hypothetical protein
MNSCTKMRSLMCNSNRNLDHNFFCGLFFDALSVILVEDECTGKDLDVSYRGLIEVLSQYFPVGREENRGRPHTA